MPADRSGVYRQHTAVHQLITLCLAMLPNYFLSTKGRNYIIHFFQRFHKIKHSAGDEQNRWNRKRHRKKGKKTMENRKLLPKRNSTRPRDPKAKVLLKNYIRRPSSIQRLCKCNKWYVYTMLSETSKAIKKIQISTLVKLCHWGTYILAISYSAYCRLITAMICASLTRTTLYVISK